MLWEQQSTMQTHHRSELAHCLLLTCWSASSTPRHRIVSPARVFQQYASNGLSYLLGHFIVDDLGPSAYAVVGEQA